MELGIIWVIVRIALLVLIAIIAVLLKVKSSKAKKREKRRREESRRQQPVRPGTAFVSPRIYKVKDVPQGGAPFRGSSPGTYRPRDDYYAPGNGFDNNGNDLLNGVLLGEMLSGSQHDNNVYVEPASPDQSDFGHGDSGTFDTGNSISGGGDFGGGDSGGGGGDFGGGDSGSF